jgi:hypothetical protein
MLHLSAITKFDIIQLLRAVSTSETFSIFATPVFLSRFFPFCGNWRILTDDRA